MIGVAVCLLTCDRYDYTVRTLESFAAHNDAAAFQLLHADDASTDLRVPALARQYGFTTVVRQTTRQGWRITRTALIEAAATRAPWILLLENDIESVRAFPWPLFHHVTTRPEIYCLRLYGRFKDRDRLDPCLTTHKRRGHTPVQWRPLKHAPESSQVGLIHWSAQPAVTRARELVALHRTGVEPTSLTARVKKNVMFHIGVERTVQPADAPAEATC